MIKITDLAIKPPPPDYWQPPKIWEGQSCFVIGGGASILGFPINRLENRNCIAVNNAFMIAPWSRYLVFHDSRWLGWHEDAARDFKGELVSVHRNNLPLPVHKMRRDRKTPINCTDPQTLAGIDSGTQAVNLAFHTGVKLIALVGFDMGFVKVDPNGPKPYDLSDAAIDKLQTPIKRVGFDSARSRAIDPRVLKHWHPCHPIPPRETNYDRFLSQYVNLVRTLQSHGVRLVTVTPTRIKIKRVKLKAIP